MPVKAKARHAYIYAVKCLHQCAPGVLLMCILAFGGVMAFSPAARAGVIRWVMERYGNRIDFVYSGEQNREALPEYGIAELPEGYVEKERYAAPGNVSVMNSQHIRS